MNKKIIIGIGLFIIFYLICAVISYGGSLAYMQSYPSLRDCRLDTAVSRTIASFGPFSIVTQYFIHSFKEGLQYKCIERYVPPYNLSGVK